MSQICLQWELDLSQIKAVITDRGANIKKAYKDLFGAEKHLSYFAHFINTVTTNAIEIEKRSSRETPPDFDNLLPSDDSSLD